MEHQEIPQPEIIDQCIDWLYRIGALRAALELRLWEKVASGEDTAEKMAAQEGWNPTGTRVLLDAICAFKLLNKEGERYSMVPESAYYLLPDKPAYQGGVLQSEFGWEGNGKLAEAIRSGKRPVQYDASKAGIEGMWNSYYSRNWACPEGFLEKTDKLWQSLEIQSHDGLRVLDVACGPVPRSLALARKHPGVHLTWLDWEGVLQTARKAADGLGITNPLNLLPGDLWLTDYGVDSFDVVYLGNVTHFFSPEENVHLFRKVHAALVPGGVIVINSAVRREIEAARWDGLWLYAVTVGGGAYDFAEYESMLGNAGFINVVDIDQSSIKAMKPQGD